MRRQLLVLVRALSVIGLLLMISLAPGTSVAAARERLDAHAYPIVPSIRGGVASRALSLVRTGRRFGNRSHVFSKIGDSITQWGFFMAPIGTGGLRLAEHGELQGVADWFSQTVARTNNSFANESLAARGGWT